MRFIKIYRQNQRFFSLVNLANVAYIKVDKKLGTCELIMIDGKVITPMPSETKKVLQAISNVNRQTEPQSKPLPATEAEF